MEYISSSKNPKFRLWQSLLGSKGLKKEKKYIASGIKIIRELLGDSRRDLDCLIFDDRSPPDMDELNLNTDQLPRFSLAPELFASLDLFGTSGPLLVGSFPPIGSWEAQLEINGLGLYCSLGDPSNLGSVLRSAEAFSCSKVVLLKEACHPFHPKAIRASSGSCFRTPLFSGPSIKDLDTNIIALDPNGKNISDFNWPVDSNVLMGEEGEGLPKNLKAQRISIPMNLKIDSLNAAVASGIALYSYRQSHKLID